MKMESVLGTAHHKQSTLQTDEDQHGGTHVFPALGKLRQRTKNSWPAWAKQDPVKEWGKENVFLKAVINKIPTAMYQRPKGLGGSEPHS